MPIARSMQRDRIGAVAHADRVGCAACRGELRLERLDFGAEHEPSAGDDAIDGGAHARQRLRQDAGR